MDNNPIPIIDRKHLWKTRKHEKAPKNYNNETNPYNEYIGGDTSKQK